MTGDEFYVANHGEPGPSGSRGTRTQFNPSRVTMGHFHVPGRPRWYQRVWDYIRFRKQPQMFVAGSYSVDFESYSREPFGLRSHQLEFYQSLAIAAHGGKPFKLRPIEMGAGKAAIRAYCERDVEIERRIHIVKTQPAAWINDGQLVYDSWYWTGRSK